MGELRTYLIEECKMLGCDTDTEGCENPDLALASRACLAIVAKDKEITDLRQQLAASQQEAAAGQARVQIVADILDEWGTPSISEANYAGTLWTPWALGFAHRIEQTVRGLDHAALDAALAARDDKWLDMLIEACKAEDDWKVPDFDPLAMGILLIKSTLRAFIGLDEHNAALAAVRVGVNCPNCGAFANILASELDGIDSGFTISCSECDKPITFQLFKASESWDGLLEQHFEEHRLKLLSWGVCLNCMADDEGPHRPGCDRLLEFEEKLAEATRAGAEQERERCLIDEPEYVKAEYLDSFSLAE